MSAPGGILPLYYSNKPVSFWRFFRSKEKIVIFLVFLTFCTVCFGTFFYLPEFRGSGGRVYEQIKRAGPDLLIPPPPQMEDSLEGQRFIRHEGDAKDDPHILDDREKLKAKIEEDSELKVLERPDQAVVVPKKSSTGNPPLNAPDGLNEPMNQIDEIVGARAITVPPAASDHYPLRQGGEDREESVREKRDKVKEMMKHAWDSYVKYAWGKNELKPVSKKAHTGSIFGSQPLGASILDSMDTLYMMGMHEEFKQAKEWITNELDIDAVIADVSVFETNIRFIGGLLTCFALTGEVLFRDKAQQIADKLLPAFNTPTGIPNALVNFKTGSSKNYGWASGSSSILSEFGTLHLEFSYLSDITGKAIYRSKVDKIRQVLNTIEKPNGLYPNYLNPRSGKWGQHHMSMGALGDSFYEYLLKAWLQSGKEDNEARQMFDESMDAAFRHMLHESPAGLTYFADLKFERVEHKMDHLACFSGGMLALASKTLKDDHAAKYMDVAKRITNTCHESYDRTHTKLGPEAFRFSEGAEARALKSSEKYYILRPETIEAYFYLYRLTKDEKYRDWGWEAVQALEKYCRVPGGYTGIKNVYSEDPQQDDVQQSFFLAETLKYLYLLFSDEDFFSLDQWVYNTEAHPLPIKGVNPFYRESAA